MRTERKLSRLTWTLADQSAVSLATFLVSVILARQLPATQYGVFALMFGGMLALQVLTSSLLFYPLSIRIAAAHAHRHATMASTSVVMSAAASLALSCLVWSVLFCLGLDDIALPAAAWFLMWQVQEATRRCLLAGFRHRASMLGDCFAYFGQVAALMVLSSIDALSLPNIIASFALPSAVGALIQARQLRLSFREPLEIRATMRDFWLVGRFSLLNNLVSTARMQAVPWVLAVTTGPAAVAAFQAVLNLANLANPIVLGLCNIIPQTAAQASIRGLGNAWRAARIYAFVGAIPTFVFYLAAMAEPQAMLMLIYGADSPYVGLADQARLLIAACFLGYAAEMVCSFLHGVDSARRALTINAWGLGIVLLASGPLTTTLGVTGACLAVLGAGAVRLACAHYVLGRMIGHVQPQPA